MERTMTVEEKIKRAEEIYARRHGEDVKSTATLRVNGKEKKDIKLFKKLFLQMVACLLIYFAFYTIQHSNFIFSEDFVNKAKELLSYDTNFGELYSNVSNGIQSFFNKQKEQNMGGTSVDNQNGAEANNATNAQNSEQTKQEGQSKDTNEQQQTNVTQENAVAPNNANGQNVEMTEEEKKIAEIKNTTTFIKPIEGVISSRYGHREPTTSTVPKEHTGTDIAANLGTKIKSSTDGEVVIASSEGDYRKTFKNKNWKCKYYLCTL